MSSASGESASSEHALTGCASTARASDRAPENECVAALRRYLSARFTPAQVEAILCAIHTEVASDKQIGRLVPYTRTMPQSLALVYDITRICSDHYIHPRLCARMAGAAILVFADDFTEDTHVRITRHGPLYNIGRARALPSMLRFNIGNVTCNVVRKGPHDYLVQIGDNPIMFTMERTHYIFQSNARNQVLCDHTPYDDLHMARCADSIRRHASGCSVCHYRTNEVNDWIESALISLEECTGAMAAYLRETLRVIKMLILMTSQYYCNAFARCVCVVTMRPW